MERRKELKHLLDKEIQLQSFEPVLRNRGGRIFDLVPDHEFNIKISDFSCP